MDLQTPCNACILISQKPALPRQSLSRSKINIPFNRCKAKSELRTAVAVNGGVQSPSVPTTKSLYMTVNVVSSMNFSSPRHGTVLSSTTFCKVRSRGAGCRECSRPLHSIEWLIQKLVYLGCCTSCAVRVKSGQLRQPEALGISAELKSKGYALLCVGFPSSDLEVETQDEDEVYWLQFGRYFARGPIERDDYALELAMGDE
ncbi:UNVERIFIED_CONTAM: Ferredoxin C 2, chloroplastic [Sesamum latifolium]|uniref:Ferredoxin C 2, chloroplastic n=1 Tax=Sesamum latifolium TaxID=2727402 RepID=A0AAW2SSN6_9LAMI